MPLEKEKFLVIAMPNESHWAVPVLVIAQHRAKHYAHEFGGDEALSLSKDTQPLFDSNDFEIEDWAANNMNWDEIKTHAVKLGNEKPTDFQEGWTNGKKHVVLLPCAIKDAPAPNQAPKLSAAVRHLLYQLQRDGRLAWLIGPGSQSYELLTQEGATAAGQNVEEFRKVYESTLKYEPWPSKR